MSALYIALKDLQIFIKDRANVVNLFLLPFVFIFVFMSVMGGGQDEDEDDNLLTLPVVNLDHGGESAQEFIDALDQSGGVRVKLYDDQDEAETLLDNLEISQFLIIPANFSQDIAAQNPVTLRLINHPDVDDNEADMVLRVVNGVAQDMSLMSQLFASLGQMGDMQAASEQQIFTAEKNLAQAQSQFERSKTAPLVVVEQVLPQNLEEEVPELTAVQQYVPGYTIIFVFLMAQATAMSIYNEKKVGTFRRLLAAPLGKSTLLAGKMIPNFIMALVQVAVIFGVGVLVLPMMGFDQLTLGDDPLALVLVTLLLGLCSTGLGIFIAAIARTEGQIGGIGTMALWTMGALGGCLFPAFLLGGLSSIGKMVPHYWALRAYQDLITRGRGLADVTDEMLPLLGFTVLFFAIGLWRFEFD